MVRGWSPLSGFDLEGFSLALLLCERGAAVNCVVRASGLDHNVDAQVVKRVLRHNY